jgi:hypothetical protein
MSHSFKSISSVQVLPIPSTSNMSRSIHMFLAIPRHLSIWFWALHLFFFNAYNNFVSPLTYVISLLTEFYHVSPLQFHWNTLCVCALVQRMHNNWHNQVHVRSFLLHFNSVTVWTTVSLQTGHVSLIQQKCIDLSKNNKSKVISSFLLPLITAKFHCN